MKEEFIFIGELPPDGEGIEAITAYFGDSDQAKEILKQYLNDTPKALRKRIFYEALLIQAGFIVADATRDEVKIEGFIKAGGPVDILWPTDALDPMSGG